MRKLLLTCVCALCVCTTYLSAQNTPNQKAREMGSIKSAFINMPDSLMPMIGQNARKDLIDFIDYGMKAVVENEWGGRTTLTKLEPGLLSLQEDSRGSVVTQIGLFPTSADTIICIIRTLSVPQLDSEIQFYDSSWQPLRAEKIFSMPKAKDFPSVTKEYTAVGSTEYFHITLEPKTASAPELKITLHADDSFADQSDTSKSEGGAALRYKWSGTKFTLIP